MDRIYYEYTNRTLWKIVETEDNKYNWDDGKSTSGSFSKETMQQTIKWMLKEDNYTVVTEEEAKVLELLYG